MRACVLVLALAASACGGNTVVGTWRLTSNVTLASGPSQQMVSTDFGITPAAWKVTAGCDAPLTFSGQVAQLTDTSVTCMPADVDGLPFASVVKPNWAPGDPLVVNQAYFELVSGQLLKIDVSLHIQSAPNDPYQGDVIDVHTTDGKGAQRVQ